MKREKRAIIYMVSGFIILIFLLHLYSSFFMPKYNGISASDFVLIITAIALFWYTWETRQMRKEIVNQTRIQSSPFVTIFAEKFKWGEYTQEKLCVKNDGEITARNIEIRLLESFYEGDKDIFFLPIETLANGEKKDLKFGWVNKKNKKLSEAPHGKSGLEWSDMRAESFVSEIAMDLKFDNIFNECYHSDVKLTSGEFLIRNFQRVR